MFCQRTACRGWIRPSITWAPGDGTQWSGLVLTTWLYPLMIFSVSRFFFPSTVWVPAIKLRSSTRWAILLSSRFFLCILGWLWTFDLLLRLLSVGIAGQQLALPLEGIIKPEQLARTYFYAEMTRNHIQYFPLNPKQMYNSSSYPWRQIPQWILNPKIK